MPTTLEIREDASGIRISVAEPRRVGRALATLAAGSAFLFILVHSSSNSKAELVLFGAVLVFSVLRYVISSLCGTAVELLVTELDVISHGHAPEDYGPSVISRAEIYKLEFRNASGGGDFPELPMGLYVQYHGGLLHNPSSCVLPNINQIQTEKVIQAIYRRFPDTGKLPPIGAFEPYLTSLNPSKTAGE